MNTLFISAEDAIFTLAKMHFTRLITLIIIFISQIVDAANGGSVKAQAPLPPIRSDSEIGQPIDKEDDPLPRPKTSNINR